MKRLLVCFSVGLILSLSVNAQGYKVGTNTAGIGIGLGSDIAGYSYSSQTPAISLQYDRGLWDAGPGVISLGGYVGFKQYKDDAFDYKWNYTIIGVRGAWHYTGLNNDQLDLYGGMMLSYNDLSFSVNGQHADNGLGYNSFLWLTAFVGARYYFIPQLAAFGELGYGVSYLTLGLALKF